MKPLLYTLLAGCLAVTLAAAVDKAGGTQLKQFKLGEHLFGPQTTASTMHGKAVLLDCWGIHCGPCLAMMPEVEGLSKRYPDKLVVVGVHSQENDRPAIEAVVKKNNLTYTIVNGVTSPLEFRELPHVFIFDSAGGLVFNGSPFDKEFQHSLHKAVDSVTSAASGTPSGLDSLKKLATPAPAASTLLPPPGAAAPATVPAPGQ